MIAWVGAEPVVSECTCDVGEDEADEEAEEDALEEAADPNEGDPARDMLHHYTWGGGQMLGHSSCRPQHELILIHQQILKKKIQYFKNG